jgi:N,N'-diacetyllegionaminate synthase
MKKVLIIAEVGVNHNGDVNRAIELIRLAAEAGADYVKFQTFKTELNISKVAKKAEYQISSTGGGESQYDMVKKLELSFDEFVTLRDECKKQNIGFLSTGFDEPSINFLVGLNIDLFKIPSGELTNKPYLKLIARAEKPIVMSTGMANLTEIAAAISILTEEGISKDRITVLHCNTEYPTPMKDVNLLAMNQIKTVLDVNVGYSDHTLGIEVPIAAVALGAEVIEKHFTTDKTLPGPDHAASLEPHELIAMVAAIRNIELAIGGSGLKEASDSEKKNIEIARKSIHLIKSMKKGDVLSHEDLIMMRPGDGISPMEIDRVVGKILTRDIETDSKLFWEDIS